MGEPASHAPSGRGGGPPILLQRWRRRPAARLRAGHDAIPSRAASVARALDPTSTIRGSGGELRQPPDRKKIPSIWSILPDTGSPKPGSMDARVNPIPARYPSISR